MILEFVFYRNLKKEEDENYLRTGIRKHFKRLPYEGLVTSLIDLAAIKYCTDNSSLKREMFSNDDKSYLIDRLINYYVAPLVSSAVPTYFLQRN